MPREHFDADDQIYDENGKPVERRHDGFHGLVDAITANGFRIAQLEERIKAQMDLNILERREYREDITALHEKVNKHPFECPLGARIGRLEVLQVSKTGFWAGVIAFGGVLSAGVWHLVKVPVTEWAKEWMQK